MKVKICGITNVEDALLCCELGADALGFIFYDKSKRFIHFDQASEIINKLPIFIHKVGVFVNQPAETVNSISKKIGLTTVQLHGDESPEYINHIQPPAIKSFRINDEFDFSRIALFKNCSILLDSHSLNELGGTGTKFNWSLIPEELKNKIILAGGISSENIESIYSELKPQAIDLSSSVESLPGKKDKPKLIEFFNKINRMRFPNDYKL